MMITNQITLKVQLLGEDMDLGNFVFQKCVPRGGYREQIWRNLNIGASLRCASRFRCQESTYFGTIFIKIR